MNIKPVQIKYLVTVVIFLVLPGIQGCEDFLRTEFHIEHNESDRKLAATAILDTDSGRFSLSIAEALPLGGASAHYPVIAKGTVRLFEDNREILVIGGPFIFPADSLSPGVYRKTLTGITARAGCMYRIEINIDGYNRITSSAVMPGAPVCSTPVADLSATTEKTGIVKINSLQAEYFTRIVPENYYRTSFLLSDPDTARGYYSLRMFQYESTLINREQSTSAILPLRVAVDNHELVKENPDLESKSTLLYTIGYELLAFDIMVFTDIAFAGSHANIDLFVEEEDLAGYLRPTEYPQPIPDFDPVADGMEVRYSMRTELLVSSISPETFVHYRSLAMQQSEIRFLGEPATVQTNMDNGYGCFSLQNTVRFTLLDRVAYYYPGK